MIFKLAYASKERPFFLKISQSFFFSDSALRPCISDQDTIIPIEAYLVLGDKLNDLAKEVEANKLTDLST